MPMWFKKKEERTVGRNIFSSFLPSLFSSDSVEVPARNIVTVYSSIRLIASVVADTPLKHVKITDDRTEIQSSTLQKLLDNPNPFSTTFDIISSLTADLMYNGNAFLWKVDDNLFYIPYEQVAIYVTQEYRAPVYYVVTYFGQTYTFWPDELIHIKNPLTTLAGNGYIGVSPLEAHRVLLQGSSSQTSYQKNFFENASNIIAVIETEKRITPEAAESFQKSFKNKFGGVRNAGKVPLLHDGLKYKQLKTVTPADADFIRNQQMTKQEIAEVFGVPPSLLGIGEQKYSNAEQANISFQNYTISPIMAAISQELTRSLLPTGEEKIVFRPSPLKYASSKEKSESLSLLRNSSIITTNEARVFYDLPPLDNGDKLKEEVDAQNAQPVTSEIGDEQQAPKDTDFQEQNPMDRSRKEINDLRSEIGRLKAKLKKGYNDE